MNNQRNVNLPRYRCKCYGIYYASRCRLCNGKETLLYQDAVKVWGILSLPLGLQVPQCHICTKFETEDNELFAYSILGTTEEYRLIYRCVSNHDHDIGMKLIDVQTGMEVVIR